MVQSNRVGADQPGETQTRPVFVRIDQFVRSTENNNDVATGCEQVSFVRMEVGRSEAFARLKP